MLGAIFSGDIHCDGVKSALHGLGIIYNYLRIYFEVTGTVFLEVFFIVGKSMFEEYEKKFVQLFPKNKDGGLGQANGVRDFW